MAQHVQVLGVAKLRASLRAAEDMENLTSFRDGLKAAADIVAQDAKGRAGGFSGRAAASIKAGASGNRAYVAGGSKALPWYGWADFGSRTPRTGQPRTVGPWAHSGKGPTDGRFIYPALEAKREQVHAAVSEAVNATLREAGL